MGRDVYRSPPGALREHAKQRQFCNEGLAGARRGTDDCVLIGLVNCGKHLRVGVFKKRKAFRGTIFTLVSTRVYLCLNWIELRHTSAAVECLKLLVLKRRQGQ